MISNGLLTQLRLPQPVLKTLQKRLVLLANRLDPLLIRLGMLRIRHLTLSLCNLPDFSPLVSSLRQDRLAILGFFSVKSVLVQEAFCLQMAYRARREATLSIFITVPRAQLFNLDEKRNALAFAKSSGALKSPGWGGFSTGA